MWSCRQLKALLVILAWTIVYYATSAASGVWNKHLVDANKVSPTVLTLLHLLVSLASDVAIMRYGRDRSGGSGSSGSSGSRGAPEAARHSAWEIVSSFTPISLFVIMNKLATYLSYQHVSVALSHTAKASEPIFNVIVAGLFFREFHSRPVYLSLVPIALGVALASVTDFTYNHTGFFWATASALMKVLQNIYTKRLMTAGRFSFWEIHMYCGAASLAILAPVLVVQTATSELSPWTHLPVLSLTMCSLLQYVSSVSSYMVLLLVAHLTFTIINVMKRLFIILSGMALSRAGFGVLNTLGVVLAVTGILAYNVVKDAGAAPPQPQGSPWSLSTWVAYALVLARRYNDGTPEDAAAKGGGLLSPALPLTAPPPTSQGGGRGAGGRGEASDAFTASGGGDTLRGGSAAARPPPSAAFSFWTGPTAPPPIGGDAAAATSAATARAAATRGSGGRAPGGGLSGPRPPDSDAVAVGVATQRRTGSIGQSQPAQHHIGAPAAVYIVPPAGAGGHGVSPPPPPRRGAASGGDDDASVDGSGGAGSSRNRRWGGGWAWAQGGGDGDAALTAAAASPVAATPPRRAAAAAGVGGDPAAGFFSFSTPLLSSLMSGGVGRRGGGYMLPRAGSGTKLSDSEDAGGDDAAGAGAGDAHRFAAPRGGGGLAAAATHPTHPQLLGEQRASDPYALYAAASGTPLRAGAAVTASSGGGGVATADPHHHHAATAAGAAPLTGRSALLAAAEPPHVVTAFG